MPDDLVPQEHRDKVHAELEAAKKRVAEILMYRCKYPGCDSEVKTNKGVGSYCNNYDKSIRMTHRRWWLNDNPIGRGNKSPQPRRGHREQTLREQVNIAWKELEIAEQQLKHARERLADLLARAAKEMLAPTSESAG